MVVDVLLHVSQLAADDLNKLGRQMLRVDRVDSAKNELVDDGAATRGWREGSEL